MNLHAIALSAVAAINPCVTATIRRSTGYTTADDGSRTPSYAKPARVQVQVQSLQYNDLIMTDGLDIQGERRAMYINGNWDGVVRADQTGGDLITLPDGSVWLVAMVLENWASVDGWVKVAVTRQS
jgi:hypothetical protein